MSETMTDILNDCLKVANEQYRPCNYFGADECASGHCEAYWRSVDTCDMLAAQEIAKRAYAVGFAEGWARNE